MKPKKEWYKSRTVWAALAAFIIALLSALFGETSQLVAIAIGLASAVGIYGRVNATEALK